MYQLQKLPRSVTIVQIIQKHLLAIASSQKLFRTSEFNRLRNTTDRRFTLK